MPTTATPTNFPPTPARPGITRLRRAGSSARGLVRQIAAGVDAFSRVRHGLPVPPGHPARDSRDHA